MIGRLNWVPHVFGNELKKVLSYRVAFWLQFAIGSFTDMAVAYFLWLAIYSIRGVTVLEGYTFSGIVYYYLFASFTVKITRGNERGYLSQDVYDGSLSRFLLYPMPFLAYKYVTHLTQQVIAAAQLLLGLAILWLLIGESTDSHLTISTFLAGLFTAVVAGYLHFVIDCCLEMVAFWQDVVWNLIAMLRFISSLVGGAMIPLSFFPEWGVKVVMLTPFPWIISYPIRTFLGLVSVQEWLTGMGFVIGWSAIFTLLAAEIWSRGVKHYSGVGI